MLSLSAATDEEGHLLENEMNQEEDFVSIGKPFSKHVWDGPRHHQHEDILRYVQQALDDIRWTID